MGCGGWRKMWNKKLFSLNFQDKFKKICVWTLLFLLAFVLTIIVSKTLLNDLFLDVQPCNIKLTIEATGQSNKLSSNSLLGIKFIEINNGEYVEDFSKFDGVNNWEVHQYNNSIGLLTKECSQNNPVRLDIYYDNVKSLQFGYYKSYDGGIGKLHINDELIETFDSYMESDDNETLVWENNSSFSFKNHIDWFVFIFIVFILCFWLLSLIKDMPKSEKKLVKNFYFIYGTLFLLILISVFFKYISHYRMWFVFVLFISLVLLFLKNKILSMQISEKQIWSFCLIIMSVVFLSQLIFTYQLATEPCSDSFVMYNFALDLINQKEGSDFWYVNRFPNNIAMELIMLFEIKLISFFMQPNLYCMFLFNMVALDIGIFYVFYSIKKYYSNQAALLSLIMIMFYLPIYVFTTEIYTNVYSLPFVSISLYLFICISKQTDYLKKYYCNLILLGIFLSLAVKIKGNLYILFAAVIIYLLTKPFIYNKRFLSIVILLSSYILVGVVINLLAFSCGIVNKQAINKYCFPKSHWIMMASHENGTYDLTDNYFSEGFNSYEKKNLACSHAFLQRLSSEKVDSFLTHCYNKEINSLWFSNLYGRYYNTSIKYLNENSFLYNILISVENKFESFIYSFSVSYYFILLILVFISILNRYKLHKFDFVMMLHLCFLGIMIFFMLWECSSSYLFNLIPVLIILAVDGLIAV